MLIRFAIFILLLQPFGAALFAQCDTSMTRIPAGTYASYTLSSDSYIAAGDVVNVTGTFTVGGRNFCNAGTLNAGVLYKNSVNGVVTNSGTITVSGNITLIANVVNSGTIETTGGTFIRNSASGGPYTNVNGGILRVYGNISAVGDMDNCGTIEITNSGTFSKNSGSGTIHNRQGSLFHIRSNGLTSTIGGNFINDGVTVFEGEFASSGAGDSLTNTSTGYFRGCQDLTHPGPLINSGTMDILGNINMDNSTSCVVTNNAGGIINVTKNMNLTTTFTNSGCVNVGGTFYKKSSAAAITLNGGSLITGNYTQISGQLVGGSSPSSRGYLVIRNVSQETNVTLSGYLDICDSSSAGVAPYFDSESNPYAWPLPNITDCGSSPSCSPATFVVCSDPLPTINPCSILTTIDQKEKAAPGFSVYPNPSNGMFTIRLTDELPHASIEIYNLMGEKVGVSNSEGRNTITMDLNVPSGVYLLRMREGNKFSSQKIIIQ